MKKASFLLILTSLLLSSCSLLFKEKVDKITIAIAPSAIPSEIMDASSSFSDALKSYLYKEGYDVSNIEFVLYDTHTETLNAITNNEVDIAYLPMLQYLKIIDQVDYMASVTRSQLDMSEVASDYNNVSISDKPMSTLAYRRALIYTGPSTYGQTLYDKFRNNETISWIDLNVASWCHVVVTNLDGYIFPSLWLIDNYGRRMGELFNHTLEVKGYQDVVAALADESCDIAVGPSLLRYDYASAWTSDYSRSSSIFDEVKVIGVTQPIYDNVFVSRKLSEEDSLSVELMTKIQTFLTKASLDNTKLYQVLGFDGVTILTSEDYQSMQPALEYIERIMS